MGMFNVQSNSHARPLNHLINVYVNYAHILYARLENTDEKTILSFYVRVLSLIFFFMKSVYQS